jgi:hypothetical protein
MPRMPYNLEPLMSVTPLSQYSRRSFAACFCLLAVVLLYAPLSGAAWASHAMSCCNGDHCNIPQHHHQKTATQPASHKDCDHGAGGLMACSMSCCQNPDQPIVSAMIFVLPQLALAGLPNFSTRAEAPAQSVEIPGSIEPISPPPRIAGAAL